MEHLTTHDTIRRGSAGPGGWRALEDGPGEPHDDVVADLRHLATVWHLSDLHVCDSESTARLEYLDRYSDPDSPYRDELGDIGTYRPQEAFTVQVAVTMVETVNTVATGPVLGSAVDAVVLTGDLTDNAQRNELSWYQLIVEGGTIAPRSGDPQRSSWVGATNDACWDDRYWHPDGPSGHRPPDRPTRLYGFPTLPGLADAARCDVTSPGLRLPWVSVHGNHDALLQGTVAPTPRLRGLATGSARIVGLPAYSTPALAAEAIAEIGPARYIDDQTSDRIRAAADGGRDFLHPGEFAATTRDGASTYFAQDVGALRLVCLDTVNPHGGWQGSLDRRQLTWLTEQLLRARSEGRRVVLASHHPSFTLTNGYAPDGEPERVLGDELLDVLLGAGIVVAWIAGHVHFHSANRLGDERSGFWEITTSSLIDWPQQARLLEFAIDEATDEVCVISTVADHHAPAAYPTEGPFSPTGMASVSRALAANDYRLREGGLRGLLLDSQVDQRNAMWRSPDPLAAG